MVVAEVRRLLLAELDPSAGACTLAPAHLVGVPHDTPATPEDIVAVVTAAMGSGQVPIGPIEYSDDVDYGLHAEMPLAIVTTNDDRGVTLKAALAFSSGGHLGLGGSRYGRLPHLAESQSPSAVLLPDVEAALAELVVYTRERARLIGYTGRVAVRLEIHAPERIEPWLVDAETGRAAAGARLEDFPPVDFQYSLDMSWARIRAAHYEAAGVVARRFGADQPQFLSL